MFTDRRLLVLESVPMGGQQLSDHHKPQSKHWLVFKMLTEERQARKCDFVSKYFNHWRIIVFDDSSVFILRYVYN